MRAIIRILGLLLFTALPGVPAAAMPIQPVKVILWDIPNGNQIRGTASFQGLPKGVAVQLSLRVASYGPDTALIGSGTCAAYKKVYALKPAIKGLSNTLLPTANMITLFKTPHVVVLPRDKYCGVLKSAFSH